MCQNHLGDRWAFGVSDGGCFRNYKQRVDVPGTLQDVDRRLAPCGAAVRLAVARATVVSVLYFDGWSRLHCGPVSSVLRIQRVEICILRVGFLVVRLFLHRLGCGSGPKRAQMTV